MRTFISYSHQDKDFVRRLSRDVARDVSDIWIDELETRAGESVMDRISEGLSTCDYVLAVISRASVESAWVREELNLALHRQLEERRIIVIPILIERVGKVALPAFLREKKFLDFSSGESYHAQMEELRRAIGVGPIRNSMRVVLSQDTRESIWRELASMVRAAGSVELPRSIDAPFDFATSRDSLEGYAAACLCCIELSRSAAIVQMLQFLPHVMGIYGQELLDEELFEADDPEISCVSDEYAEFWSTTDMYPSGVQKEEIELWCPPGELRSYIRGWNQACSELATGFSIIKLDLIERRAAEDRIVLCCARHLHTVLWQWDKRFQDGDGVAWTHVCLYLADKTGAADVRDGIAKLYDYGNFTDQMDSTFQLTDDDMSTLASDVSAAGNGLAAVELFCAELRASFEFVGNTHSKRGVSLEFKRRR